MNTKTTAVAEVATDEQIAELNSGFPVEAGFSRVLLPRLGMISQDKMEGKGKLMKVVAEAGTFFTDVPTEEVDEDGKKTWNKVELGKEMEGIIIFQRKQLRMYDEKT